MKPVIVITAALTLLVGCAPRRSGGLPPLTPASPPPATAQPVLARWPSGQASRVIARVNSTSADYYADGWERSDESPDGHITPASQADESIRGVVTQLRRLVLNKNPSSVVENASVGGYDAARAEY